MAEAILSSFLQVAFDRLASPILKHFGLIIGADKDLKRLTKLLNKIWGLLNDAEERQLTEEPVKFWLRDLKDVAYDIDDLLDEINTNAMQQQEQEQRQSKVKVINSLLPFNSKSQFVYKIRECLERLEEVIKEGNDLGLVEKLNAEKGVEFRGRLRRLQSSSFVDETCVFGREEEKEKMIELLVSERSVEQKVCVVPIVGMGGLGKTTLAQVAYNDFRVKEHFELRIWVFVSDDFDVKRITRSVIESASKRAVSLMDLDPLQVALEEVVTEKRLLLVLDDVWHEKECEWDVFLAPFRGVATGSRVVVTTRSEMVSSIVGTIPAFHLRSLPDEHCWSVFASRAFKSKEFHSHPNLVNIGKQIVKKCQGLPLAAKTLGGLLHFKDYEEWEAISSSTIWDLPQVSTGILPALKLSYYNLPAHLKRCFIYCSIFPKDYVFDREKLVQLWIAEGFVQPNGRDTMEEIGNTYFDDLLWRSFFQKSCSSDTRKIVYTMHDLIHCLAENVAATECFRMENNKTCNIAETARHSSLLSDEIDSSMFDTFFRCSSLRTFMLLREKRAKTEQIPSEFFLKVKSLRVLDLSNTCLIKLPKSVGNLIHLRYCDVSRTPIKRLPESISALFNLQILKLRDCYELLELPKGTMYLVNLQHLELEMYSRLNSVPLNIGRLTKLQTLSAFMVGKDSRCGIQELQRMTSLRGSLAILKLENVTDVNEARKAELTNKSGIHKLDLIWSRRDHPNLNEDIEEAVLRNLTPHTNIKELTIRNFRGIEFPSWIHDPSFINLESVKLLYCMKCIFLPPLGHLPCLKELHVGGLIAVKTVGLEFCGGEAIKGFLSLERLTFMSMPSWETWNGIKEGDFPSLHEINISVCHKLTTLSYIPQTVKTLKLSNCRALASLPALDSIHSLTLEYCHYGLLRSLPNLASLHSLNISGFLDLATLHRELLSTVSSLKELYISSCNDLLHLFKENESQYLPSLERIEISECSKLESLGDQVPTTLRHLKISSCPRFRLLSNQIEKLGGLEHLEIKECEQIVFLPEGTQQLASLRTVEISCCPLLSRLPQVGLPMSLQYFSICECPLLEECLGRQSSEDWQKLVHVETVLIDGKRWRAAVIPPAGKLNTGYRTNHGF